MYLYPLPVFLPPSRDVADGRLPHRGGTASRAGRLSRHLHVRFAPWAPRLPHVAAGHIALGGGPCRVCCRPLLRRRFMTPRARQAEVGVHLMRYRASPARPGTENTRWTPRHKRIDAPRAQRCADPDRTIPQQLHCAQRRVPRPSANSVQSPVHCVHCLERGLEQAIQRWMLREIP